MYYTDTYQPNSTQRIVAASVKLFEYLKLSLRPGMYKNTDSKEWLACILSTTAKNSTVVDIGSHKRDYLFDILKVANQSATVIVFENNVTVYNYLLKMKQWLKLKNVVIEKVLTETKSSVDFKAPQSDKNIVINEAPVIDINDRINRQGNASCASGFLDKYFWLNQCRPDLLKIKVGGNEQEILKGAIQTLRLHKPKILLECRETQRSRESLLATFKMLEDLEYTGYFILDTMKIPLANFDFNIYQHEVYGFYCNNFLFE